MESQRVRHNWVTSLTHSHSIHLKLRRLELTIERSYQTHSHNIHLKITRLVRMFLLRRNYSQARYTLRLTKMKQCRKKLLSFSPPWEPWTPFSFSRALDPFLLEGPGLLINLTKDELSQRLTSSSSLQAALKTPSTTMQPIPLNTRGMSFCAWV